MILKGKSASPGFVVGQALLLDTSEILPQPNKVDSPSLEIEKFNLAQKTAFTEIENIRQVVEKEQGPDKAAIFEAHLMMLEDPELTDQVKEIIQKDSINADYAVLKVRQGFEKTFAQMDNEYLKERIADIKDVTNRLIRLIQGKKNINLSSLPGPCVLVAKDLTPSETATMDKKNVLGILTDVGGKTSHTAIMARTLEIPAVVGLKSATSEIHNGQWLAFDGEHGEVITDPDSETKLGFLKKREKDLTERKELQALKGQASRTKDGHQVHLVGNIGAPGDVKLLEEYDAEGVGLVRSEFLFIDHDKEPTESEQLSFYKSVIQAMKGKLTVIRTLDIGGDKQISYLKIPKEENPFLGMRAIRYCLKEPAIFKTQLRALCKASAFGPLSIMIPMITTVEEVIQSRKLLNEVIAELKNEGVTLGEIKLGIMVEVPSVAFFPEAFAPHVDFFSIGTNDLTQYICAVDRLNEKVADLYDYYNPAVLRAIQNVITQGHNHNIEVGMCGEMAGTPELIPLLIGMGLKEFSMNPAFILRARKIVQSVSLKDCENLAKQVLTKTQSSEIRTLIEAFPK